MSSPSINDHCTNRRVLLYNSLWFYPISRQHYGLYMLSSSSTSSASPTSSSSCRCHRPRHHRRSCHRIVIIVLSSCRCRHRPRHRSCRRHVAAVVSLLSCRSHHRRCRHVVIVVSSIRDVPNTTTYPSTALKLIWLSSLCVRTPMMIARVLLYNTLWFYPILRQHYVTSTYIVIFITHRIRDVPNTTTYPSTASVPTFYFMCYISS